MGASGEPLQLHAVYDYKSHENPYLYCKSHENPYQYYMSHKNLYQYYKSRENLYQILQVSALHLNV